MLKRIFIELNDSFAKKLFAGKESLIEASEMWLTKLLVFPYVFPEEVEWEKFLNNN